MADGSAGEVSVAIANWNGMKYIERCLVALYAQTQAPAEIVVVDNGFLPMVQESGLQRIFLI